MRPTLALASIEAVVAHHKYGHTCDDGTWWNERTGTRSPCPIRQHLTTAADQITRLHAQVHAAAHDTATAVHVAEAMTGLVMVDLPDEEREGWTLTARMAIEGLAAYLDRDTELEARAAATKARLEAVWLPS